MCRNAHLTIFLKIHYLKRVFKWVILKYSTTHNYLQPPTTIHNHPTVWVCVYKLYKSFYQLVLFTIFWLDWLVVFVSIQSNSFDVNSDEFYFLKIWIYELLPFNIQQRSAQQSSIYAHELSYYFLRILRIFRGKLCCLLYCIRLYCCFWYQCGNFKREWNSVVTIRSKCCKSLFLRNITVWNDLLGNLFKIL